MRIKVIAFLVAILLVPGMVGAVDVNWKPYRERDKWVDEMAQEVYDYVIDNNPLVLDLAPADSLGSLTFQAGEDYEYEEILRLEYTGDIYWRDKFVTTDKELVEALRDVVESFRCPKCKMGGGEVE